jgi:short subunit dehydrogenase-like uncharacterized protein
VRRRWSGQKTLATIVRRFPEGPNRAERLRHQSTIWAEASDPSAKAFRAVLATPNAYDFTASSALAIATRLGSLAAPLGLVTPVQAFGADFVLTLLGCSRRDVPFTASG